MRIIYGFLFLVTCSLFAGEILVTNDFSVIENQARELDKDSLLLFDVDATLIIPKDAILKPKGKAFFKELISKCTDRDLFREIRMKAHHELVDSRSIDLIHNLQENKIPVLAFTAAPSKIRGEEELGAWRVNELQKYGFDFSSAFPDLNFLVLPKQVDQEFVPLFKSGVLYSSFHPKGDVLIEFLQSLSLEPKKVIFVDDEIEHVQSVVTSLDKQAIPCIGIHYTAADDFPCDLQFEQARFQIDYFIEHGVWLSDGEAVVSSMP